MVKAYYSDHVEVSLPVGHRFPMAKYRLLRERVEAAGLFLPGDLLPAQPASEAEITLVHTADYYLRVLEGELSEKETRRIGFPWSQGLVARANASVGATIAACRAALREGMGASLAGGTHHAYPDHGEGFCVFNDVAIAARVMLAEGLAERVVIIDCDVHQGNGTAAIFRGDANVFTFSIHCRANFPAEKEHSDLDIALPAGSGDDDYLRALEQALPRVLHDSDAGLSTPKQAAPVLAIYIAGADPHGGDRLGRLSLSKDGLLQRDRRVVETCRKRGIPVAVVMGGGYGKDVADTVEIHFNTLRLCSVEE